MKSVAVLSQMLRVNALALLMVAAGVGPDAQAGKIQLTPLNKDGMILRWLVLGPLPNAGSGVSHGQNCSGYHMDHLAGSGGEAQANPVDGERLTRSQGGMNLWHSADAGATTGILDFIQTFDVPETTPGVAYAYCILQSDTDRRVLLRVHSDDGIRLWVNGKMVLDHHTGRGVEEQGDDVPVDLVKGMNRLMAKVDQGSGGWALSVAVTASDGGMLAGVTPGITVHDAATGKIYSARINPTSMVLCSKDGNRQLLTGHILTGGIRNAQCRIEKSEWQNPVIVSLGDLPSGMRRFDVQVPVATAPGPVHVSVSTATDTLTIEPFTLAPPRDWVVHLVQHTHTDIGYTRPQHEMLPEQLRFIDDALDYCDATDGYPDDAKFRWTCETSWALREYLRRRPAGQVQRLVQRIHEGRIEVTGMYLNMSETSDENVLVHSLQPIRAFAEAGIPVRTAMQDDVNGIGWGLVDYFADAGVKYLTMGINKTRSLLPFDKPTVFWWESPSGKRIMAFRADHYMAATPFIVNGGDMNNTRTRLGSYLADLEAAGYPFSRISVQFGGYSTDNNPPATKGSDLVRSWNEQYAIPKLRLSNPGEFMEYVEKTHSKELPVYRVAWPDWWTDGVGTAARETGVVRRTHAEMHTIQGLAAMSVMMGDRIPAPFVERSGAVQDNLLFYDEHTYGASESISDPHCSNSMVQWSHKGAFAWESQRNARLLREEGLGLILPHTGRAKTFTLSVFNSLNWERGGVVEVFIDHEAIPADRDARIVDEKGTVLAKQRLRTRAEGSLWAMHVPAIPAMGWKTFRIEPDPGTPVTPVHTGIGKTVLDGQHYRLEIDPATGGIRSLLDRTTGRELADRGARWQLGQIIHEKVKGREELTRSDMAYSTLRNVRVVAGPEGPVWQSLMVTGDVIGCEPSDSARGIHGVTVEYRMLRQEKRIELHVSFRKAQRADAEAHYVAFPFSAPGARIVYEAQGGESTPGVQQLPGSSTDWQTVQNYASVRGKEGQILFSSDEAPLVMWGDLNMGKWMPTMVIDRPHIYSFAMNNYWVTNFLADQYGEITFRYSLTSTTDTTTRAAVRFGWGFRTPLVGRVLPPRATASGMFTGSVLHFSSPDVLLVNARPAATGNGVILHLREIGGKRSPIDLGSLVTGTKPLSVVEVNAIEKPLGTPAGSLVLDPYEVKFLRLSY